MRQTCGIHVLFPFAAEIHLYQDYFFLHPYLTAYTQWNPFLFPYEFLKQSGRKQKVQRISLFAKNLSIFRHKNTGNRQFPISGIFIIFSYIYFICAPHLLQHPILQNIVIPQKFSNDRLIDLSEQRLFQHLKRHRKLHLKRGLSVHELHRAV